MKKYYFIAGLPRSGSTLLCNILAQNPRFHATPTSGILDVMFGVRNQWNNLIEFKAAPNEAAKKRVLRAIFESYHSGTDHPVIFDKSRGWIAYIGMMEELLGGEVKILVPVRDIRDILVSFEKIFRRVSKTSQVPEEAENYFKFQTVEGRCEVWLQHNQPLGLAYNRIQDAVRAGYLSRLFFVDFEDLTNSPNTALQSIYNFLGEAPFEHDFDHIKQVTQEDDIFHGIPDLHRIRESVKPVLSVWKEVLGESAERYGKLNFWSSKATV